MVERIRGGDEPREPRTRTVVFNELARAVHYSDAADMEGVKRLNRRKATLLAKSLLDRNITEDRELAGAFHTLAESDRKLAGQTYKKLLSTKIHRAQTLRKLLDLPASGRIFPKRKAMRRS